MIVEGAILVYRHCTGPELSRQNKIWSGARTTTTWYQQGL